MKYNPITESYGFHDAAPEFVDANTFHELVDGQVYCIEVFEDNSVVLNGKKRMLVTGFNSLLW